MIKPQKNIRKNNFDLTSQKYRNNYFKNTLSFDLQSQKYRNSDFKNTLSFDLPSQ